MSVAQAVALHRRQRGKQAAPAAYVLDAAAYQAIVDEGWHELAALDEEDDDGDDDDEDDDDDDDDNVDDDDDDDYDDDDDEVMMMALMTMRPATNHGGP